MPRSAIYIIVVHLLALECYFYQGLKMFRGSEIIMLYQCKYQVDFQEHFRE